MADIIQSKEWEGNVLQVNLSVILVAGFNILCQYVNISLSHINFMWSGLKCMVLVELLSKFQLSSMNMNV